MAAPNLLELYKSSDEPMDFMAFLQKANETPEFWEAMGKDRSEAERLAGASKQEKVYKVAEEKAKQSIEGLAENKNKGLGKYSKLRQVVKSQLESGGVQQVPTSELLSKDLQATFAGTYSPRTRNIKIAETLSPQGKASLLRHERTHDFQEVGKQLKEPIGSNWERLTWLESEGKPGIKSAIGRVASEIQARAVQGKSTPKALLNMAADAKNYVGDTDNPFEKALYKGISVFEQPARLTAKAIKSGIPQKIGKVAKGLGAGLASGLAEAPKYEFLNPPSAGPSDPEDPVYQYERGLISQAEFNRRMGK
jgi:hypothetical protein